MAQDLHEVGVRVEELLAELTSVTDPAIHQRAEALVSLLVEFYGAGLERILALVAREPSGDLIVRRLAQDDLLASLFVLHGIHPVPVEDRVHITQPTGVTQQPRAEWLGKRNDDVPRMTHVVAAERARRARSP